MGPLSDTVNPLLGVPLGEVGPHPRHIFAVVTWGCTASMWLAKALDSHPEVLCLHAGNLHIRLRTGEEALDGVDYMWVLARDGSAYTAVGDIHGVSRTCIPAMRETFGDEFSAAVLVREPMSRLGSQLAHFEKFVATRSYEVGYVDGLIERHDLRLPTGSYEEKLFVHGVNMLNAIVDELHVGPIYRTEDVTADAAAFAEFARQVTAGAVAIEDAWVAQVVRMPRVNRHAKGPLELEPWQLDTIRRLVSEDAWQAYAALGYEVPSFAESRRAAPVESGSGQA